MQLRISHNTPCWQLHDGNRLIAQYADHHTALEHANKLKQTRAQLRLATDARRIQKALARMEAR